MAWGLYEHGELHVLEKLLKDGDIVIDAGANVAYMSAHSAQLVGTTGRVYSFEPGKRPFRLLNAVCDTNKYCNIEAVSAAVSDRDGERTFFDTEDILNRAS